MVKLSITSTTTLVSAAIGLLAFASIPGVVSGYSYNNECSGRQSSEHGVCPGNVNGLCNYYYVCSNGGPVRQNCPPGTYCFGEGYGVVKCKAPYHNLGRIPDNNRSSGHGSGKNKGKHGGKCNCNDKSTWDSDCEDECT
ncbi:hypothetical protein H4219_004586 [Mycoemilia scoparia]|uniref:Chitin-binding type-2 domain-containing protein n=1 Tax=Mycoemilia scoparia TaxID=417184 RepID=A0A9W8A0Q8_9FUNG|nr:hypothetical protein H4219_004586 [Mycoemilia scoparia]